MNIFDSPIRSKLVQQGWNIKAPTLEDVLGGRGCMREGHAGPEVQRLQEWLRATGYEVGSAGADGKFGPSTRKAVEELHRRHGMVDQEGRPSGVVDQRTLRLLQGNAQKLVPGPDWPADTVTRERPNAQESCSIKRATTPADRVPVKPELRDDVRRGQAASRIQRPRTGGANRPATSKPATTRPRTRPEAHPLERSPRRTPTIVKDRSSERPARTSPRTQPAAIDPGCQAGMVDAKEGTSRRTPVTDLLYHRWSAADGRPISDLPLRPAKDPGPSVFDYAAP